jgi:hypothetical protein
VIRWLGLKTLDFIGGFFMTKKYKVVNPSGIMFGCQYHRCKVTSIGEKSLALDWYYITTSQTLFQNRQVPNQFVIELSLSKIV